MSRFSSASTASTNSRQNACGLAKLSIIAWNMVFLTSLEEKFPLRCMVKRASFPDSTRVDDLALDLHLGIWAIQDVSFIRYE